MSLDKLAAYLNHSYLKNSHI